ncbi:FtsX-like permease family protein [Demequina sp. SO4-18]|uniref:ABC transporter permease n=1 Tax=Demequina sp. SO4-18 TaxID=3401026 RepID=UPI003B59559E
MRPAAARLLVLHGGGAYRRLAGIVGGVALGVGMLLILLGGFLHMPDRDARSAWTSPGGEWIEVTDAGEHIVPEPTPSTMLMFSTNDYFEGETISVVTTAASPDTEVTMPGGLTPPAPGEYYASPAMAEIIDATPPDMLEQRYGTRVAVLPDEMLAGPSQRAVLTGDDWDSVAVKPGARLMDGFPSASAYNTSATYRLILALGAIAILVPIVLLISIVGQLGAAERRDRLATVRLIGAGRGAVAALAAWEMAAATALGSLLGVGVAALVRPGASVLVLNGSTSFAADLTASWGWTFAVVLAVTALGALTAGWRAFSDDVGAPGATRERAEKPVTAWRTTTLVLGIVLFAGSAFVAMESSAWAEVASYTFLLGFAMTAFGIVIAGPWLTGVVSAGFRTVASSAPAVVAAGRLARHPRSTFRSVAGLVVAVFIVSVFAGSASAIDELVEPRDRPGLLDPHAVMASVGPGVDAAQVRETLSAVEGVEHVAIGFAAEGEDRGVLMNVTDARAIGAVDLPGSGGVILDLFGMLSDTGLSGVSVDPPRDAPGLVPERVTSVIAVTDGASAAIERARTALIAHANTDLAPTTRADYGRVGTEELTDELAVMAYLGMGIAIGIAAVSLAVATAAAALDRRRTFGLLRLAGMSVRQLRATISIEATVPLLATLVASAGLGFAVAWTLIETLGEGATVGWPDERYWIAIAAALAIAAIAVTGSFGTVRRSTEMASTRFE